MRNKVISFLFILLISSCTLISRYDIESIANADKNEARILGLYKTFDRSTIDEARVKTVKEGLMSWIAYEEGKKKNSNTVNQLVELIKMFDDHVKNRRERGVWTHPHIENQIYWIKEAFKVVRETENLKPKRQQDVVIQQKARTPVSRRD